MLIQLQDKIILDQAELKSVFAQITSVPKRN